MTSVPSFRLGWKSSGKAYFVPRHDDGVLREIPDELGKPGVTLLIELHELGTMRLAEPRRKEEQQPPDPCPPSLLRHDVRNRPERRTPAITPESMSASVFKTSAPSRVRR